MKRVSVAPMVDCTDRLFRWVMRRLAPRTVLYTEMISAPSLIHGDADRFLGFDPSEHPVALQLASNDPRDLERTTALGFERGYDEVNLNCGCPSDKVQNANYGACLMATPSLVHELVQAMVRASGGRPVTVKHRIGIPGRDRYEHMEEFARAVMEAGAARLVIHARIAILEGLNPKENRTIPPLRYEEVARLKAEHPEWPIDVNGGITALDQAADLFERFDGVMIGRAAYDDPYFMADLDRRLFGAAPPAPSRSELLTSLLPFFEPFEEAGVHWHRLLRHLTGLFHGLPGAGRWRRLISPPFRRLRLREVVEEAHRILPAESLELRISAQCRELLDPAATRA